MTKLLSGLAASAALAANLSGAAAGAEERRERPERRAVEQPAPPPAPAPVVLAERQAPPAALQAAISAIGRSFPGKVGIAVRPVDQSWVAEHDGFDLYPQQSVSKLWVALAALEAVDRGEIAMHQPVLITRDDLTLFNQPIAQFVGASGYRAALAELMRLAMIKSDNTANDSVLRTAGGPAAVRAFLARHQLGAIRFGPGERLLQAQTAGLSWQQSFALGRGFEAARAALPLSVRQNAFSAYLASPPDGAAPVAMVEALAKLKRGELLSPASTRHILATMAASTSGPRRLKGGLPPGWTIAHKTGTGQVLGATQAGYNDVGVITAPDGTSYAVAVLVGRTSAPIIQRMTMMQAVTRAVASHHQFRGRELLDRARTFTFDVPVTAAQN